ncbi:MAG: hypothetical protein HZA01_16940 [Nitrospinae bacterium]|nr:hypothetical protein [Nitrospinota bacterium]
MWKNLQKNLDEGYMKIKSLASMITLKAEEKAKLARMQVRLHSMKKEMDAVMMRLGNEVYTLREQDPSVDIMGKDTVKGIFAEGKRLHGDVLKLQEEMEKIQEEYEAKIKTLYSQEVEEAGEEAGEEFHEPVGAAKERGEEY